MKRKMKLLARHRWVNDCKISESCDRDDTTYRRFTATIDGWQKFKIYEGFIPKDGNSRMAAAVIARVRTIQRRIRDGDDSVFHEDTQIFPIR